MACGQGINDGLSAVVRLILGQREGGDLVTVCRDLPHMALAMKRRTGS